METNFIYNNPHPKGLNVKDCAKRAITIATGKDYNQVKLELNRIKKETGCKKFNNPKNIKYYLEKVLGLSKISFPAIAGEPRMNGYRFTQEMTTGTYILRMAGHITCSVNGVINDTWDCSDKCVYNAWRVK